jgi:radical SAM superfamily enzyme YgiQ (UPF0313 family)
MKILLIDPKVSRAGYSAPKSVAAFGLLCVATYLNHKGHKAEILDMNAAGVSWEELPEVIGQKRPDMVGVPSSMNCYVPDSLRAVRIAKSVNPAIVTVGGGINFTLNSENIMRQHPELDFIVRGDGEYTSLELVQALESGGNHFSQIDGLTWRDGEGVILNPDRPPIIDLDSLPLPDWDLVDLDNYGVDIYPPAWGKQVLLTISRGCPYNCLYCSPTRAAQRYRELSAERALEELIILRRKYGRKMIWMNDLTFGVNEERTAGLLEGIIREGLDANFAVDMTADLVIKRQKQLPLMRKAGFKTVAVGVETPFEEDRLKFEDNAKSPHKSEEAFRLLRKNKIDPWAYVMIGEISHTAEKIRRIREYTEKLDPTVVFFAFVTPQPGTPYAEEVRDYIITDNLACYAEHNPVMRYPYLTDDQIRMLYREVWISYYARPTRILRRLLFGGTYGRHFCTRFAFTRKWGWHLYDLWRQEGCWQGYSEDEKKLKKWARKQLGLTDPVSQLEEAFKWLLKRLGKM